MQSPRIGIIGTGAFARAFVLPALRMLPARIVAAYDLSQANAEEAATRFGIENVCGSLDELLDRRDLELVCVHTFSEAHPQLLAKVIDSGHHFVCEKPVGLGSAHVRVALEAANRASLVHAVDHEFRYAPVYRRVYDLVQSGYFGELRYVSCSAMTSLALDPRFPTYYCNNKTLLAHGGGLLPQSLSHHIDLLEHFFAGVTFTGGECATMVKEKPLPPPIGSSRSATQPGVLHKVDAEDAVALCGHLSNGAPVALNATWSVHNGSGVRWEIYGSDAALVYHATEPLWEGTSGSLRIVNNEGVPLEGSETVTRSATDVDRVENMHRLIAAEFADVIGTIRNESKERRYATLESELQVWTNIERVRTARSPHK